MMTSNTLLVPRIESRIQVIRGQRVMLDVDLAALYGVQTKRLNEQVKRNRDRFPSDFLFQLTADEKAEVVANSDHLQNLKFSKALPFVFTEHGAIQAANVLASTNMSHAVRFADAFPVAAIVSTQSAKSLRRMMCLAFAFPDTGKVASMMRLLSRSQSVNLLQMHKDGITVAEYRTERPPKAELEQHLHQALIEARERLARTKRKRRSRFMWRRRGLCRGWLWRWEEDHSDGGW